MLDNYNLIMIKYFCKTICWSRKNSYWMSTASNLKNFVATKTPNNSQLIKNQVISPFQHLSNQGKRIDLVIYESQHIPSFIQQHIISSEMVKAISSYNAALTNGGTDFEEFPLTKLLHCALRDIHLHQVDVPTWKRLESAIRKRLHCCTLQQNMRLLYIMLKVFPMYRFDYNFIFNTCLALKKQLHIMNDQQFKTLFYILAINKRQTIRYSHSILVNLQTLILTQIIQGYKGKHMKSDKQLKTTRLSTEHICKWIYLAVALCLRNNYQQLTWEKRCIELIQQFNKRCETIIAKQQNHLNIHPNKEKEYIRLLKIAALSRKIVVYYPVDGDITLFRMQFQALRVNLLAYSSRLISATIRNGNQLQKLTCFRAILQLYSLTVVENMLYQQGQDNNIHNQIPNINQNPKYQSTLGVFLNLMKIQSTSFQISIQKIRLIVLMLEVGVLQPQIAKAYYHTIYLPSAVQNSLEKSYKSIDLINQLIKLELYLYVYEDTFDPRKNTTQIILSFLINHNKTYRQFDWLSYHFLNILSSQDMGRLQISTVGIENFEKKQEDHSAISALRKLVQEVEYYDNSKLIKQDIQRLKKKTELREIQKFFIEIKVHEMSQLEPVLHPFNRIPHFSNKKDKIAINACSSTELQLITVKLEKKLMGLCGWRVINIDSSQFRQLTINQKLQFLTHKIEKFPALKSTPFHLIQ